MAEKSAQNVVDGLEASKKADLWRLIFGLGILHVGAGAARALATHFGSLDAIAQATEEQLCDVRDIGEVVAQSITHWFAQKENQKLVERLRKAGLNFKAQQTAVRAEKANFTGKTFVITGTLSEPRDEIKERIIAWGGKVSGSVSKKTDYLVAGENAGSKLDDAQRLNVNVITERQLAELAES